MLKADLHLHTKYSCDSYAEPEDIVKTCQKHGINCLAVTDHGQIAGALAVAKIAPFKVIIGEEVLTPDGEIIGLFLQQKIPSPCSALEAVAEIKKQGGLVVIPHPFDGMRKTALKKDILKKLVDSNLVDAIEIVNGRVIYVKHNHVAQQYAEKYNLFKTAGSDAHRIDEIGNTFVELPDFETPQQFLQSLNQATIVNKRRNFANIRFGALWERAANRKEAKKTRYSNEEK